MGTIPNNVFFDWLNFEVKEGDIVMYCPVSNSVGEFLAAKIIKIDMRKPRIFVRSVVWDESTQMYEYRKIGYLRSTDRILKLNEDHLPEDMFIALMGIRPDGSVE